MTDEEIDRFMEQCDLNGDGQLDFNEFITAAYDHKELLNQENRKKIFDMFDKDKKGKIDMDAFKMVLPYCNHHNDECDSSDVDKELQRELERWNSYIQGVDNDGNKEITYEEFE